MEIKNTNKTALLFYYELLNEFNIHKAIDYFNGKHV